jgi:hypothetical protein
VSKWDVERAMMRDTRGREDRAWVLAIPPLPPPARHIMHALLSRADADTAVVPEEHTPSLTELEHLTGYTRSTVRKWLNHLEAAGWTDRDRPDVADAQANGAKTRYRLMIPGRAPGALPNIDGRAPDALGVGREMDGGRAPDAPIPSPDLLDLDQSNAAASGTIDQREEEPPPGRGVHQMHPDVTRVIAGIHGAGRSWAPDIQAALDAGHLPGTILEVVNAPLTEDVRSPVGARRHRLRDLAATPPDPDRFYAALYAETHPPQPPAPDPHLCPEHGRRSRYLPTGQCAVCLVRDHPELDQESAWMPDRDDAGQAERNRRGAAAARAAIHQPTTPSEGPETT